MDGRTIAFGESFYTWLTSLDSDVSVYRGVLPYGQIPASEYMIFNGVVDGFGKSFILPVRIYTKNTTSYRTVLSIAKKIEEAVTEGGTLVIDTNVRFKIDKGSPFYQDLQDEDETVKAGYVNLEITIY